jgi:hypothetical protein
VSELRDAILASQGEVTPVTPVVDWQEVLNGLDAIGRAVAELRRTVEGKITPNEDSDGKCLHPASDRRQVASFSQELVMCHRCGEFL